MINDGTVTQVEDGYILRFEFEIEGSPEEVWASLTEPANLAGWLGEGTIEPRVGGKVHLKPPGGDVNVRSEVTVFDPPHDLEYHWNTEDGNGGPVHWTLSPAGEKTKVVFTHHMPEEQFAKWRDMVLAGWHSLFDRWAAQMRGETGEWAMANWEVHHKRYSVQNG